MKTTRIEQKIADITAHNHICHSATLDKPGPALLLVHAFEGMTPHYVELAQKMAAWGLLVAAVDMYGQGQTATDLDGCMQLMSPLMADRACLRERILAQYAAICAHPLVDAKRVAVLGYCFGGKVALDCARAGADIRAAVSLHGAFDAPDLPCQVSDNTHFLILHSYDDPLSPPASLADFAAEMQAQQCDRWQAVFYGGTKHAFTDPDAHKIGPATLGRAYNAHANEGSTRQCRAFLQEVIEIK